MNLGDVMQCHGLCLLTIVLLEIVSLQHHAEVWVHQKEAFASTADSIHQARPHPPSHAVSSLCGTQVLYALAIEDLPGKAPPLLQSMAMTCREHEQVIVTLQVWEDEEVVRWVIHSRIVPKYLVVVQPLLGGIRPTCLLARVLP